MLMKRPIAIAATLVIACSLAQAATLRRQPGRCALRWTRTVNESLQLISPATSTSRWWPAANSFELVPGLATSWTMTSLDRVALRTAQGVTFHDGTPFTADDVVFSFKRAAADGSDMKSYTAPIKEVRKGRPDDRRDRDAGAVPDPPDTLTTLFMMSQKWCEANRATVPVDRRKASRTASFQGQRHRTVPAGRSGSRERRRSSCAT